MRITEDYAVEARYVRRGVKISEVVTDDLNLYNANDAKLPLNALLWQNLGLL